jgi:hypothetical protein
MASGIRIELTRLVDRDALRDALEQRGLEPWVVAGDGGCALEVDGVTAAEDVIHAIDAWVAESRLPLVPTEADGTIFVRPCCD